MSNAPTSGWSRRSSLMTDCSSARSRNVNRNAKLAVRGTLLRDPQGPGPAAAGGEIGGRSVSRACRAHRRRGRSAGFRGEARTGWRCR
jgi:hypothetical protein